MIDAPPNAGPAGSYGIVCTGMGPARHCRSHPPLSIKACASSLDQSHTCASANSRRLWLPTLLPRHQLRFSLGRRHRRRNPPPLPAARRQRPVQHRPPLPQRRAHHPLACPRRMTRDCGRQGTSGPCRTAKRTIVRASKYLARGSNIRSAGRPNRYRPTVIRAGTRRRGRKCKRTTPRQPENRRRSGRSGGIGLLAIALQLDRQELHADLVLDFT